MKFYQLIVLLACFSGPIIYQRGHFAVAPKAFLKTTLRDWLRINLHHAHWGILWILIASVWLLFGEKCTAIIGLMGFGWGLLIDEIFPSLFSPSPGREVELQVYHRALPHTLILAGSIIVALIVIFFICRYMN